MVNRFEALYYTCGMNLSAKKQRLQSIDYLHVNSLKTIKNKLTLSLHFYNF